MKSIKIYEPSTEREFVLVGTQMTIDSFKKWIAVFRMRGNHVTIVEEKAV